MSIAAPSRMMNTSDEVLAVSTMTSRRVLSTFNVRQPLQARATRNVVTAIAARTSAVTSPWPSMFLTLMGETWVMTINATTDTAARAAGM